jgi:hypothetical protein
VAVLDSADKLVMEAILETKAELANHEHFNHSPSQWQLQWGNLRGNLRAFNFELSATVRTVYHLI